MRRSGSRADLTAAFAILVMYAGLKGTCDEK
jgi:hypothetical protein